MNIFYLALDLIVELNLLLKHKEVIFTHFFFYLYFMQIKSNRGGLNAVGIIYQSTLG